MGAVLGKSSYIDDIAAGTKTWDELCKVVDQLLYRIRYWGLSVSLPKSSFGKRKIEFLSHEVSRFGLRALPKVVKGIDQLKFPTSLKGVQSFLGSLNYYHKFIEDFSVIASVLYELTDEQIKAGRDLDRAKLAFEMLKERIQSPPVLKHPDRTQPYAIILHANPWAVSAVLAQEYDGKLWPVRFTGRTLQDAELRYHESEKEVLALLRVLTTFYTLVAGQSLVVYTRYSVLKWMMTSKSLSDRLLKWATYLSPWSFEVRRLERDQDGLARMFAAGITPREKLDEIAEELVPAKATRSQVPVVSLEMLDAEYEGYVLSFDGAAKLKTNAGSAGFILWKLPGWEPVHAEGVSLVGVTVNEAEYAGMLRGLEYVRDQLIADVVVVGDSRIAIQQCQGIIGCNQAHLQLLLNQFVDLQQTFKSVRLAHVKREFNAAADYLTSKCLRLGAPFVVDDQEELRQIARLNELPVKITKPTASRGDTDSCLAGTGLLEAESRLFEGGSDLPQSPVSQCDDPVEPRVGVLQGLSAAFGDPDSSLVLVAQTRSRATRRQESSERPSATAQISSGDSVPTVSESRRGSSQDSIPTVRESRNVSRTAEDSTATARESRGVSRATGPARQSPDENQPERRLTRSAAARAQAQRDVEAGREVVDALRGPDVTRLDLVQEVGEPVRRVATGRNPDAVPAMRQEPVEERVLDPRLTHLVERQVPDEVRDRDVTAALEERWRRIRAHQDADPETSTLKKFLAGTLAELTAQDVRDAAKVADQFVLDSKNALRYVGNQPQGRARDRGARLVVPVAMREDVLHLHHSDLQGGHQGVSRTYHRVRSEYYWRGMFRDVEVYVRECIDCSTSKGKPPAPGPSPGNIMPDRPLQVISMDFVLPLPASRHGNTALLLFQDMFSGFVLMKAMSSTTAQDVAEAYEEVVFRRFGASSTIRHDRDPRFMSEVFSYFARMMKSQQRATLAYRPQANGQQERSVQTVIRSVRAFVEEPGQEDWEDLAYRLAFALNTSVDATRRETPFFILHGWDPRTTMSAMLAPAPGRSTNKLRAYAWRIQIQRQHELAIATARQLQADAKQERADERNQAWEDLADRFKTGFEVGDAVWLYLARVQPGLSRKLAHSWHGPFRIAEKSNEFMCKLSLENAPYRVFPWVHISRLKPRLLSPDRPALVPVDLPEDVDFDAALLPEDSWAPDEEAGEYEVEELRDVRWGRTRAGRHVKEYLVKWLGYDELTWEPVHRLHCGRLLFEFDRSARGRARFAAMQADDGGDAADD